MNQSREVNSRKFKVLYLMITCNKFLRWAVRSLQLNQLDGEMYINMCVVFTKQGYLLNYCEDDFA